MSKYQLSQTIITDAEPVRSLGITPTSLMTGSESGVLSSIPFQKDGNQCFDSNNISIQPGGEGTRHSHHITALIGGKNGHGDVGYGGYATGCKDKLIRVFDSNHALIHTLSGHDNAVTSLSWLTLPKSQSDDTDAKNDWTLISGSWDGTAKLWDITTGQCLATLPGHENTVSVQGLPPMDDKGRIATGSAGVANGNSISDYKIRLWEITRTSGSTILKAVLKTTVEKDHSGPIRGLAYDANSQMLLSCSNDGTVRVRDAMTGESVTALSFPNASSQPPMLLSVCATDDGRIVAGAEDGNVIVWNVNVASGNEDDAVQVISHPNCVWKVMSLPGTSGDFVTACHDGTVRVFTTNESRVAPEAERAAFEDAVLEARAKSSSGPSQEEIASLPKWESNANHRGRSEGQVQVFNKGGKAIAAQWSAASGTWIEVGEVTGRNENSGTIDGTRYDHVFPIEIDMASGGVQKMQIGYNNGENPFVVAQKFIDDYMLDQGYLAQIADYIRNRVGEAAGPTLGMAEGSGGGGSSSNSANVSSGPVPMDITPAVETPAFKHLPMKGYKSFETGADSKILIKMSNKIREFNESLSSSPNNNLSPEEASTVLDSLCETLAATNRYHATSISDSELIIVLKMMKDWSLEQCFPAIDLARLTALHPDAAKSSRSALWNSIVTCALEKCEALLDSSDVQGTPKTAIPMLTFRLVANCFKGGAGAQSAVELNLNRILKCVGRFAASSNKNVRLALATVLLNTSSYLNRSGKFDDAIPELFLPIIGNMCGSGLFEVEAMVRVLVGFGTVLLVDDVFKRKAIELNMGSMLRHISSNHGDLANAITTEILSILQ